MAQTKEELEAFYSVPDPWRAQENPDDIKRRHYILKIAEMVLPYRVDCCLDIGAGEGWITQYLPAIEKFGYEVSDKAASRFPPTVKRIQEPINRLFGLVVANGVLYDHYDIDKFIKMINKYSSNLILTCNIKHMESQKIKDIIGRQIIDFEFPYKPGSDQYMQKLRVYETTP